MTQQHCMQLARARIMHTVTRKLDLTKKHDNAAASAEATLHRHSATNHARDGCTPHPDAPFMPAAFTPDPAQSQSPGHLTRQW